VGYGRYPCARASAPSCSSSGPVGSTRRARAHGARHTSAAPVLGAPSASGVDPRSSARFVGAASRVSDTDTPARVVDSGSSSIDTGCGARGASLRGLDASDRAIQTADRRLDAAVGDGHAAHRNQSVAKADAARHLAGRSTALRAARSTRAGADPGRSLGASACPSN